MDVHEVFTRWVLAQGVQVRGIKAHKFPGRGVSILAEDEIKADTTILTIPSSALRHAQCVPKTLKSQLHDVNVHGLLAADLAVSPTASFLPWLAVLPTYSDFASSMPLLWDPKLQELLSATARKLLKAQEVKVAADGNHSNDFLLVEYGFVLEDNRWDEIVPTDAITPHFNAVHIGHLTEASFFGNYVLDNTIVCYRTQVTLHLLCMPLSKWRIFVGGSDTGPTDQENVNKILQRVLASERTLVGRNIAALSEVRGLPVQQLTLLARWKQIDDILNAAYKRVQS